MVRRLAAFAMVLSVSTGSSGCRETTDSLGYHIPSAADPLGPMVGPAEYPNPFRDVLGKSEAEIADKINAAFTQLFHGDPQSEAIYVPDSATGGAYIFDVLHSDVRSEGMGLGMLLTVQLNKQDEFDRLWRYAKAKMRIDTGSSRGYFESSCNPDMGSTRCLDPYGMQQIAMALLFARVRWMSTPAAADYGRDATELLTALRLVEDRNGGVVDGIRNAFDPETHLVRALPTAPFSDIGSPAVEMPAYYELWAQASRDPFWMRAASAARAYWKDTAHPTTGLFPARARFDGAAVPGADVYRPECYRVQLGLVVDHIWFGREPWHVAESDRLLRFFVGKGVGALCQSYSLDGSACLSVLRDEALVAANGATASIATATAPVRTQFIERVWNMPTPSGQARYYSGLLYLHTLLILGGQFRVPVP